MTQLFCIICGRCFYIHTGPMSIKFEPMRQPHAVTCSKACSSKYSWLKGKRYVGRRAGERIKK